MRAAAFVPSSVRGALCAPAIVAFLAFLPVACGGAGPVIPDGADDAALAAPPTDPGQVAYNKGEYAEALPLLETAAASAKTGTLLYQIGFARGALQGAEGLEARKALWAEAKPLLEKEIGEPQGATLERFYYLTVIAFDEGELEVMSKYARQAVEEIENGPDPNRLTGEDWFRLGRLHDFLREPSEAEAAYRRAISAFRKIPALNPAYQALAIVRVADIDYDSRRFDAAATGYDEALGLVPGLDQVKPFRHGIALTGAGRFEDAAAAFKRDRDPATMTESQYAGDLALKAHEAGGLNIADSDGTALGGMPLELLDPRIVSAASEYREARVKHSMRPGDPLPAEVAQYQKRFATLLRERLLQTQELQEFCLKEGIADLVRR